MEKATLYRWGGWMAMTGGLLLAVDVVAHLFVDDTETPVELAGMPHELWHAAGILGIVAALLGLVAIYLRQHREVGLAGLLGFGLLVLGMTLGAAYSTVFHAVFLPALEDISAGLFSEFISETTPAQAIRGIAVQALGLGLGAILFGIATIRGGVLPRTGGWLFIVAALFAAANQAFDQAQLISRFLFAVAFVWLGAAVRQTADT